MKSFATSIGIRARPATIWALLTDAAGYPTWNSTVERVDGLIALGGKITVHARSAPGRAFPLKVMEFVPDKGMVWAGGMPLGLFTGTRRFTLSPGADGSGADGPGADDEVSFAMSETYGGLLAPLITRAIPDLQPAFDTFAADLKRRAESAV